MHDFFLTQAEMAAQDGHFEVAARYLTRAVTSLELSNDSPEAFFRRAAAITDLCRVRAQEIWALADRMAFTLPSRVA